MNTDRFNTGDRVRILSTCSNLRGYRGKIVEFVDPNSQGYDGVFTVSVLLDIVNMTIDFRPEDLEPEEKTLTSVQSASLKVIWAAQSLVYGSGDNTKQLEGKLAEAVDTYEACLRAGLNEPT